MSKIHPTAIIHPKAEIGAGCVIGPYCVIGAHVLLGPDCRLHSHVVLDGHTCLGKENEIFPFASIGHKTQDLKWKGGLTRTQIGDRNTFREYVTVNSATTDGGITTIGSNNHLLAYAHVAHDVRDVDNATPALAQTSGEIKNQSGLRDTECGRRFIHDDDTRIEAHALGDRDRLALAS